MYYYVALTIKMESNETAQKSMAIIKEAFSKNNFADQLSELSVKDTIITGEAFCIDYSEYEELLPEILKAIANAGYAFEGTSNWDSTYDYTYYDFNYSNSKLTITSTLHSVDDEPMCDDCEEYFERIEENGKCFYRCTECGKVMSKEEYLSACEFNKVTTLNI